MDSQTLKTNAVMTFYEGFIAGWGYFGKVLI